MSPRRAKAIKDRESDDPAAVLREHLIDAAERLLSDHQVSAITTRDIARTAGVSDGVLYNYFADKNDLVLTALLRRFNSLVARFNTDDLPEPGDATVEENLVVYARASLHLAAEVLPLLAALMSEPPLLHRYFDEIHRLPFLPQRIVEYLQGEQRLGRIPAVDATAATTLLFGAATALAHTGPLRDLSHEDRAAQLPVIVATLVRGLNPPQQPEPRGTGS
jgi:AcrR family transcriptional regulator